MGKKHTKSHHEDFSPEPVSTLSKQEQKQLCQIFGFAQLHPHQIASIAAMASGSDLLLLAGTSKGKTEAMLGSSILRPERGLTVLVEPLRVLQTEMRQRIEKLGLDAVLLNSDLSKTSYNMALASIEAKRVNFVLTTPEQLEKNKVFQALNDAGVAVVIVDEVHCLLDYGSDFRPAYGRIGTFIRHLHQRPVVGACTATLAPDGIEKVKKSLGMREPVLIRGPSDRPEIRQHIVEIGSELNHKQQDLVEKERFRRLKAALKQHIEKGDAAIVYCNTVKQTVKVAKKLKRESFRVSAFYGDMPTKKKEQVLQAFQSKKPPIIVATSAFGLGVDKPNVRLVVHMSMPLSIEDYWQKTGRAGRDGKKSLSYVFWYHGDYKTNLGIIGTDATKLSKLKQLQEFLQSHKCCVQELRSHFGEDPGKRCKHCSRCEEQK